MLKKNQMFATWYLFILKFTHSITPLKFQQMISKKWRRIFRSTRNSRKLAFAICLLILLFYLWNNVAFFKNPLNQVILAPCFDEIYYYRVFQMISGRRILENGKNDVTHVFVPHPIVRDVIISLLFINISHPSLPF